MKLVSGFGDGVVLKREENKLVVEKVGERAIIRIQNIVIDTEIVPNGSGDIVCDIYRYNQKEKATGRVRFGKTADGKKVNLESSI